MVKMSPPRPVKAVINIVTGARALDTVYQNTTGRPLLAIVSVSHKRANVVGARANVLAKVEDVTPPTAVIAAEGLAPADNLPEELFGVITFAVPDGDYYMVTSQVAGAGSTNSMSRWIEVEL